MGGVAPSIGLAALERECNTGAVWKEGLGSERLFWPAVNSLASAGFLSFPDQGISRAERDSLGLGDGGSKKLKGKESRD